MSVETESFINQLLSQMKLEEKVGQLNQYFSWGDFDADLIRQGKAGSVINASGALSGQGFSGSGSAEITNHIQHMALESRLGIPLLFGRDVIHGYRTIFPIPLAQAASFNPDLAEQAASVAAGEASADGIKWTFAPMLDIARDARWGRVAEGNGEDPYLGAKMAEALVRGFQGEDYSAPDRIVACAKHYVGYGSAEGGRDYENGEISEPTMRDIYLPPFQSAVRAGVGTIMSGFLDVNGVPATANRYLLNDVLRGEWGFDGFVVSDWESVAELIQHGVAGDRAQAAATALHAGVDMDMVSGAYVETLAESLKNGKVPQNEIDEAVRRILRVKHRAGLFDQPFTDTKRAANEILTEKSLLLARNFTQQSMVLLKNKAGLLPLAGFSKILVAGDYIHARAELYGTWSPDGRPEDVTPLDEAMKQAAPEGVELYFADKVDKALSLAHHAEVVVLALGEDPSRSGENANVSDLGLPPGQTQLIESMVAMGKPMVLVIFAGRPLSIPREVARADAVIYAWHPGIEGGTALAEVLFGMESPSGRLPITFPRATGQVPIYYNHKNSGRPLTTDGYFKSRYVDLPSTPLFPFGYGLTYTTFEYAELKISEQKNRGKLEVSAAITNTGKRAGTEVVQLYVRDLVGSLTRPIRELKGFKRVSLEAGQTQRVSFTLSEEQLTFTRADRSQGFEAGDFNVWIAPDSAAGLKGEFHL